MAEEQIIQNLIRRLGQSQAERHATELEPHFVDVDERNPQRLLEFAVRFAPLVRYYGSDNTAAGDWQPFFRREDVARVGRTPDGNLPPHLALFAACLALYEQSRTVANRLTAAHLKFFYERVLGFTHRPALPDRAHVLVESKNNAAPVRLGPEHRLSAGKGPAGERLFKPVNETIVRGARVMSLRSIFVEDRRTIHAAPIANSADGLGGEWQTGDRDWSAFGEAAQSLAQIGFGLASPVLRMAAGHRTISCVLRLDRVDPAALATTSLAFDAYITGTKGWLGPYRATATVSGGVLTLGFGVAESEPAVVDYDPAIHGLSYSAESPVVQFLLQNTDRTTALSVLRPAVIRNARITVSVSGITTLGLESDLGPLDPKRAFLPFGPQPTVGSRFVVTYPEAFTKKLSAFTIRLRWLGLPASFATLYGNYGTYAYRADDFVATVSFHDGGNWKEAGTQVKLFGNRALDGAYEFSFQTGQPSMMQAPTRGRQLRALAFEQGQWARRAERQAFSVSTPPRSFIKTPLLFDRVSLARFLDAAASQREGAVTFTLDHDFLHATYRRRVIENAYAAVKVTILEPYTPTSQGIELSYTASSADLDVSSTNPEDFSNPDLQFFQVDAFGQRRDHGYRRHLVPFVSDTMVPLLAEHPYEGELLVGLAQVDARDTVSLLVQVAEGTADPDLPATTVQWSALCDNDWKALRPEEVILDTSHQFRRSGIVTLTMPKETTTEHTLLPSGLTWLRAAVERDARAVCRFVTVAADAIETVLVEPAADVGHLATALPPGSIAKLRTPIAGVKSISQPYPSFGGRPPESDEQLSTRASERLRHKNRCITPWDYERMVLEQFPGIHRVKCVPHAQDGAWLTPGHVLLVVVPDLRNRVIATSAGSTDPAEPAAFDLLQPRVDIDTITEIQRFAQTHCGGQVVVHVKNPLYQRIRLSFGVKFRRGRDFHYHRTLLVNAIVRFLSPWAFDADRPVAFGGRIYRSVLLDFIEELDYVDYLSAFRMLVQSGPGIADTPEATTDRPDAILVSDVDHDITEAP
jgi:hypothetical protein